ncbi:MAG: hypothetical protein FD167_6153, partial [bacterium]
FNGKNYLSQFYNLLILITLNSATRSIYDRENKIILTGEVRLPDKPDGRTSYDEAVVDAHDKANHIGVEYCYS